MNISNSKKELARIISENGGWRDGHFASQDKLGPDAEADEICFYFDKPDSPSGAEMWNARMPSSSVLHHFRSGGLIAGWHQSCLSREEYFHMYPATDEKRELCESVTRSIPDPETKPTIEQLAADYRNRKDYADRKQQEADAAKAEADDALVKLEVAGEALGLIVTPVRVDKEP